MEIFYCEGRGKEQSFDLQFVPWGGAHSRALKADSHNPCPFSYMGEQRLQMTGALLSSMYSPSNK